MPLNSSLLDPQLAEEPLPQPRYIPAQAFDPVVKRIESAVRSDGSIIVEHDPERDRSLAEYRTQFTEQVVYDLSYNLRHLRHWASEIDSSHASPSAALGDAQIRDGFGRLDELRRFLIANDGWSGNRLELECGLAFQQFYCDALALGDRLWHVERGTRVRRRRPENLRRADLPGAASYDFLQALINVAEIGVPHVLSIRPLRSLLPAALYQAARSALPWPPFRFAKWLDGLRRFLTSGACASINELSDEVVVRCGVDEFYSDPYFFDQATGKTEHNVILVFAHRHPTFDLAILGDMLNGKDYGVWGNGRYLPKSAASDPKVVLVEQAGRKSMDRALAKSLDILSHQRMPLLISVDGTIPYLCYGQQMRIKRGIRLLLEYMKIHSTGSSRRTYVVPFSLDDPVSFIRGLDSGIRVTFHRPIRTNDIAPAPSPPDSRQVNWGDPLLNHLECLFLANSGQVRHGWRTPRVIETVRRSDQELARDHSLRGRLRKRFHASMFDLCRERRGEALAVSGSPGHPNRRYGP